MIDGVDAVIAVEQKLENNEDIKTAMGSHDDIMNWVKDL